MRLAVVSLFVSSALFAASSKPTQEVESALRGKVEQFYQMMRDKKYRGAEDLVAPDSRDTYYADEKPAIEDFQVEAIAWQDNFTKANVTLVSTVKMRNPRIGEYEQKVPYSSHWKFENGQWWWYIPKVAVRETPFGVMKVNPDAPGGRDVDLKAMIAKGPKPQEVAQAIAVDRQEVRLKGSKTQEVKIENKLPGRVRLNAQILSGAGFEASLKDSDLGAAGKTRLVISRRSGSEFRPGRVSLLVSPTQQVVQIAVN